MFCVPFTFVHLLSLGKEVPLRPHLNTPLKRAGKAFKDTNELS